jgi:branched-chain amino acid transport system substrate-binding protein
MKKMYFQKYKSKISSMNVPLTYYAVMLLADAIHRAGTFDRARIRQSLSETKGFQGTTGTITFDEHGDPVNKPVVIIKLGKDAPMYFKSTQP